MSEIGFIVAHDGKPLAKGQGQTLLLACGALAREVLALKQPSQSIVCPLTCISVRS